MQQQHGVSDCGLFETAVCTALAFKANPSELRWDQSRMRSHLSRCFSNQILASLHFIQVTKKFVAGEK